MTSLNDFYGFTQTPFSKSVAAKDLYPSHGHCEIQGRLAFALQERLPALLTGDVGTGKSTAVRAFAQTLDHNRFREIIMTRVTVPVGEDIGFLPGTEEEKMTPWMGALMDNLEVLTHSDIGGDWGRAATNDLLTNRIKIRSLNFMRCRTFLNKYLILDEAQNATTLQMKMFLTRLGLNSRVVITGDKTQIDLPRREDSGLLQVERILHGIEGIALIYLTGKDVIRHRLVKDIIRAYARDEGGDEG